MLSATKILVNPRRHKRQSAFRAALLGNLVLREGGGALPDLFPDLEEILALGEEAFQMFRSHLGGGGGGRGERLRV